MQRRRAEAPWRDDDAGDTIGPEQLPWYFGWQVACLVGCLVAWLVGRCGMVSLDNDSRVILNGSHGLWSLQKQQGFSAPHLLSRGCLHHKYELIGVHLACPALKDNYLNLQLLPGSQEICSASQHNSYFWLGVSWCWFWVHQVASCWNLFFTSRLGLSNIFSVSTGDHALYNHLCHFLLFLWTLLWTISGIPAGGNRFLVFHAPGGAPFQSEWSP